nr:hypothetical protein [Tanacetum cinerariifolium]
MMVQAPEEVGEITTDTQDTPIFTEPSSSQPQRKHKSRRKQKKEAEVSQDKPPIEEHIPTHSHDPLLSVSPMIYTSCIKQFWTSAKVKTVNKDVRLQALLDGKEVIINEASIRRDLRLDDVEGTACLPDAAIFEEMERMGYEKPSQKLTFYKVLFSPQWKFLIHTTLMMKNLEVGAKFYMFPRFVQVFVNHQLGDMSHHKMIFVNPSLTKKVFTNMKRVGTGFSGAITPLFETMMVQAPEEVGEITTDTQDTPIFTEPSSSQSQRKHKSRRKQKKEAEVSQDEPPTEEHIPTHSYDPLLSGEDRLQLNELMEICTKLSDRVLSLEQINTNQAAEIKKLKKRVKKLKGKKKKRTHRLKRLFKVGLSARIISSDEKGLDDQEDASKQGRIAEIDANEDLSLINETAQDQGRMNKEDLFRINDLDGDEVVVDISAGEKEEQSEKVAKKEVSTADPITITVTSVSTRPKGKGIIMQEPFKTPSLKPIVYSQQPLQPKDKGKAKMVEPERPLKKKEQIMMDEQISRDLEAQTQGDLEEEKRIAKKTKEEANIAMIVEWYNTHAMMDADYELAAKLQEEERGELSNEEKSKAITPLFETMMVQAPEEVGEIATDTQHTHILTQLSSSQPQRKNKSRRKQRKVLSLEQINTNQAAKIEKLKKRVKKLEGKKKKRTHGLKRLYKIDADKDLFLFNETAQDHGRMNEKDLFGVNNLDGDEVVVDISVGEKEEQSQKVAEKDVSTVDPVTTIGEVITTADVEVSAALTTRTKTNDELTLAQTLIEIKVAKTKALTTTATTVTAVSTRPKEKGIIKQDSSETPSPKPILSFQQPSQHNDKGKAKMVEPERPLKRKEHVMMDEQIARDLEAQMQADLEEEQRIAKQRKKKPT